MIILPIGYYYQFCENLAHVKYRFFVFFLTLGKIVKIVEKITSPKSRVHKTFSQLKNRKLWTFIAQERCHKEKKNTIPTYCFV